MSLTLNDFRRVTGYENGQTYFVPATFEEVVEALTNEHGAEIIWWCEAHLSAEGRETEHCWRGAVAEGADVVSPCRIVKRLLLPGGTTNE
jgi:hypothetical protein